MCGFGDAVAHRQAAGYHVVPLARPRLLGVGALLEPDAQAQLRMTHVTVQRDAVVADAEQTGGRAVHFKQLAGAGFDVVELGGGESGDGFGKSEQCNTNIQYKI